MAKKTKTAPVVSEVVSVETAPEIETSVIALDTLPEAPEVAPVSVETLPEVETVEIETEPEIETAPEVETEEKAEDFAPISSGSGRSGRSVDPYGFGVGTLVSRFYALVSEGKYTRAEITARLLSEFSSPDSASDLRAKKTSISVAFSDSKRPFGTYHASRSVLIEEGRETGKLRFNPERDEAIRAAIAGGILSELRGASGKPTARRAILSRFGLPTE